MEITHLEKHDLLKKLSSTDPEAGVISVGVVDVSVLSITQQVVRALMKSIDTEKLMVAASAYSSEAVTHNGP